MQQLIQWSGDAKTVKGEKMGYLTGILYLSPANSAGIPGFNVCQFATEGCMVGCLNFAGRAAYLPSIHIARKRKTHLLHDDREGFVAQCRKDIEALIRKCKRERMRPCVRMNGTSDLPWLSMQLASEFPAVQFYDYTKLPKPWLRARKNYHITFSLSESNMPQALEALDHGVNVAVVFNTRKGQALPATWNGRKVLDGDLSDLRFKDKGRGVVIGLRAKGPAKQDVHGFVQISAQGAI